MKKMYMKPFIRMVEAETEDMMANLSMVNGEADPEGVVLSREDNSWSGRQSIWEGEE